MSREAVVDRRATERRHAVAEALRSQWRLFERVTLVPAADGQGFHATIHLNPTIVRGSLEQQAINGSPQALAAAEVRRARAIAECVERCNAELPAVEAIRDYRVLT